MTRGQTRTGRRCWSSWAPTWASSWWRESWASCATTSAYISTSTINCQVNRYLKYNMSYHTSVLLCAFSVRLWRVCCIYTQLYGILWASICDHTRYTCKCGASTGCFVRVHDILKAPWSSQNQTNKQTQLNWKKHLNNHGMKCCRFRRMMKFRGQESWSKLM